ncbi:hypothetical protein [Rossellomorea arthrocnemi]|uniref:hypothetical protein n=1 Tax=Rossellomorea arthrocnemi TaxID=2769542 RepID=UPI0019180386|nr:hypothetical protein [Rossellomorea arthrocnemi]
MKYLKSFSAFEWSTIRSSISDGTLLLIVSALWYMGLYFTKKYEPKEDIWWAW